MTTITRDYDAVAATLLAVDGELEGPVNVTAPNPVTNRELTAALAEQVGRRAPFPVPAFAIRGVFGPIADELLGSKYVAPDALERARFRFQYDDIAVALATELG